MSITGAASTTRGKTTANANEIRLRLLNRLGIYDNSNNRPSSKTPSATKQSWNQSSSDPRYGNNLAGGQGNQNIFLPRRGVTPFQVPLKSDSQLPPLENKTKSKIAFSDEVSVLPIPMRNEYSTRIQRRLWSDRLETHQNIARNTMEFAAEGWNWRTVTEDDGMFVCSVSGALIHPVHCLRQGFVYPSSSRSQQKQSQSRMSSNGYRGSSSIPSSVKQMRSRAKRVRMKSYGLGRHL